MILLEYYIDLYHNIAKICALEKRLNVFLIKLWQGISQLKVYHASQILEDMGLDSVSTRQEEILEEGFTRDVREIGHFGTGDLEISLTTLDDLQRAKKFLEESYESN